MKLHEVLAYISGVTTIVVPGLIWYAYRLAKRERELHALYQQLIDLVRDDLVARSILHRLPDDVTVRVGSLSEEKSDLGMIPNDHQSAAPK